MVSLRFAFFGVCVCARSRLSTTVQDTLPHGTLAKNVMQIAPCLGGHVN